MRLRGDAVVHRYLGWCDDLGIQDEVANENTREHATRSHFGTRHAMRQMTAGWASGKRTSNRCDMREFLLGGSIDSLVQNRDATHASLTGSTRNSAQ